MSRKVKRYDLKLKKKLGLHFKELREYLMVALINGLLLFSSLFILSSLLNFHYILSLIMAYLIIITNSFVWNRLWIFNNFNPKRIHEMYLEFFYISVGAFVANLLFLFILTDLLGLFYLLSQVLIALVGFPLLFTIYKFWVFSHK